MSTRLSLAVSALFLVVQVALADNGTPDGAGNVLWLVVGLVLLWLVLRRSRVARGLVVVGGLAGAVVYSLSAEDLRGWVLAVAFAGQALPLLSPAVRAHVRAPRATERATA